MSRRRRIAGARRPRRRRSDRTGRRRSRHRATGCPCRCVAHRGSASDRARRRVLLRQLELAGRADPRGAPFDVYLSASPLYTQALLREAARAKAGGVCDQLARRHRSALEPGEDQDGVRPGEASEAPARRRGAEGSDRPVHARGAQAPGAAPGAEEDREPRARREGHRGQGRARSSRCRLRLSDGRRAGGRPCHGGSRFPHEPSRRSSTSSRSPRSPSTPRPPRTSSSPFSARTEGASCGPPASGFRETHALRRAARGRDHRCAGVPAPPDRRDLRRALTGRPARRAHQRGHTRCAPRHRSRPTSWRWR